MHYSITLLLFAVTLVSIISIVTCADNSSICHEELPVKSGDLSSFKTRIKVVNFVKDKYDTKCGWLNWKRCQVKVYGSRTIIETYSPDTYAAEVCCPQYNGTAPNCTPICEEACIHGYCIEPDNCECESNFTGTTCRDDENLLNWCSSIINMSINNDFQSEVRTSLQVYCGATTNDSFISYNHDKTSYVAPRLEADSDRCPDMYKYSLYLFWMQHPNIRGFCCYSDPKYHITLITELFKFENDFYKYIGGLKSTVATELREEIIILCSTSSDMSDPFCQLKTILDTIDISLWLPADKHEWTNTTETYKNAVLVSFAILKRKYPEYSDIVINEDFIIIESTNIILKHIQNKQVSQLRTFATYLPPNDAYLPKNTTCKTDRLCIFMKMVEQVRMYLDEVNLDTNPILVNGRKRLILNTAVDYREFLRQKQLDRILTVLAEQQSTSIQIANDLKKHTTTKFTELRSYFEKVETFNQQIATADIGYVNGRLEHYTSSVRRISGKLKRDMAELLNHAFSAVGLNRAEKATILVLRIVELANPFRWFFGWRGSVRGILDAAAALANAIGDIFKLREIKSALNRLISATAEIARKFGLNDGFLQDVKNLIERETVTRVQFESSKRSFVAKYNAYNPQVTKLELAELSTIWIQLIEKTCDVIDAIDSVAAEVIKRIVIQKGLCNSLKAQADEMISTYEEIYDFQFDLIDAMAAYVRSSVSLDAAKEISTEITEVTKLNVNKGIPLTTLAMMGGLSYVSYKVHILQTVHLYCNVLEYMEGGIQPSECKGVHTDVALLIANTESVCTSETTRFYQVPTKSSSNSSNEKAYINIDQLFSGGEVSFKIPSSDWLVENEWIQASERNHSFYVKKFEVFLPTKTDYPHRFYTTATPILHNEVIPGSTKYIIIPEVSLVYEYAMGPSRLDCHYPKFNNPYTTCETSDISEICEHSHNIRHHLYPSIYSQWKLSIKGGENMTVPDSATDLSVRVGIRLCKIAPPGQEYKSVVAIQENEQCCPVGQYRLNLMSGCMACPANSQSALAGYYCERVN